MQQHTNEWMRTTRPVQHGILDISGNTGDQQIKSLRLNGEIHSTHQSAAETLLLLGYHY